MTTDRKALQHEISSLRTLTLQIAMPSSSRQATLALQCVLRLTPSWGRKCPRSREQMMKRVFWVHEIRRSALPVAISRTRGATCIITGRWRRCQTATRSSASASPADEASSTPNFGISICRIGPDMAGRFGGNIHGLPASALPSKPKPNKIGGASMVCTAAPVCRARPVVQPGKPSRTPGTLEDARHPRTRKDRWRDR